MLTVLLDGLRPEKLPTYLRAVGVLAPEGNAAAETAGAVALLTRQRVRRRRTAALLWLAPLVLVPFVWGWRARAPLEITQPEIAPSRLGIGTTQNDYLVRAMLVNRSDKTLEVSLAALIHGAHQQGQATPAVDLQARSPAEYINLGPHETKELTLEASLEGGRDPTTPDVSHWVVRCELLGRKPVHSAPLRWRQGADFAFPNARPLEASERFRVRAVAVEPQGETFYLAADEPCELARLTSDGRLENLLLATGQALVVAAGEGLAVLGTTAAPEVHPFDLAQDTPLEPLPIPDLKAWDDGPSISHHLRELLVLRGWIWVLTGRSNESNGFFGLQPESGEVLRPASFEDFTSASSLRLRACDDELWGVDAMINFGSLHWFVDPNLSSPLSWNWQQVPLVQCATDLAEWPGEGFVLPGCNDELVLAQFERGDLRERETLTKLPVPEDPGEKMKFDDVLLASSGRRLLISITDIFKTVVFTWDPRGEPTLVFEAEDWWTRSLATTTDHGIVVLQNGDGRHDTFVIRY